MNIIIAHPKPVTFSIGLAITFVIGTTIGMVDHQSFALAANVQTNACSTPYCL